MTPIERPELDEARLRERFQRAMGQLESHEPVLTRLEAEGARRRRHRHAWQASGVAAAACVVAAGVVVAAPRLTTANNPVTPVHPSPRVHRSVQPTPTQHTESWSRSKKPGVVPPITGATPLPGKVYGSVSFANGKVGVVGLGYVTDANRRQDWADVTHDGGATWTAVPFPANVIGGLAFADAHNAIASNGADGAIGRGVFVTHDGGLIWSRIPAKGVSATAAGGGSFWIAESSCGQTRTWHCTARLLSMPATGGRLVPLPSQPPLPTTLRDIDQIVRVSGRRAYVVGRSPDGGLGAGPTAVFATFDAGGSWQRVDTPCPVSQLAATPGSATSLWLTCLGPGEGMAGLDHQSIIYRSQDAGHTWTKMNAGGLSDGASSIDSVLDLTPLSSQVAYAVGSIGAGYATVARTSDGGRTWVQTIPSCGKAQDDQCGAWGSAVDPNSGQIWFLVFSEHDDRWTPELITSRDGGRTWSAVALPGPPR